MSSVSSQLCACRQKRLTYSLLLILIGLPAAAQTVTITSPAPNSTGISAVKIASSATGYTSSDHLEVWDNGTKLGNVSASSENAIYVLPNGSHTTTVNLVVTSTGKVLTGSSVSYTVAENCTTGTTAQCNFDQLAIANPVTPCPGSDDIPTEDLWVGNYCGPGIQGVDEPSSINAQAITESGTIPDSGNFTLNGKSILFSEVNVDYSNVIFKADTPTKTNQLYSNWTLDTYVYVPIPADNQAVEIDAQYVWGGIWTKFYTECAFNQNGNGTGYWAVFGGSGGWQMLDGSNGSQTVTCDRSQFALPWSGGPSGTGWHHIVWNFIRNSGESNTGSVEYVSLTFDGTTTTLNYTPTTEAGGTGSLQGNFSALVQLDGTSSSSQSPEVYVNEFNLTFTN